MSKKSRAQLDSKPKMYFDVFLLVTFLRDCTMGFITILLLYKAEYVWNFCPGIEFQANPKDQMGSLGENLRPPIFKVTDFHLFFCFLAHSNGLGMLGGRGHQGVFSRLIHTGSELMNDTFEPGFVCLWNQMFWNLLKATKVIDEEMEIQKEPCEKNRFKLNFAKTGFNV